MITVAAAVIFHAGHVLITRRKKGKKHGGLWEFPGGKIEAGESPEQGLAREIREELDIHIEVGGFIGENSHRYPGGTIRLLFYAVKWPGGVISLSDHDACRWVPTTRLGQFNFSPADRLYADFLAKNPESAAPYP